MFIAPGRRGAGLSAAIALLAAMPAAGADFPPVTEAERALVAVPFEPNAPAVVLFERAHLKILEFPREQSSILTVSVRLKILTDEGKAYGEVRIPHSRVYRLNGFAGRTVLPDGRSIPLPDDSVFEEQSSRSERTFVTKAAFSSVEPGAILDYTYTLYWDVPFYIEPWRFSGALPVVHSEITYLVPKNLAVKPWGRQIGGAKIDVATEPVKLGTSIKVSMDDVPSVVQEPHSFPAVDLSNRFQLIPIEVAVPGELFRLYGSWPETCARFASGYKEFQRKDRRSGKRALELTRGAASPRDKAAALHAFVRDEIQSLYSPGPWLSGRQADDVLDDRRGTSTEKALLLATLLRAVEIDSDLIWAPDRREGRVDLAVAVPGWFDRVFVALDLDGGRIYLDPFDRSLGFGRLSSHFEGMPALVFDGERPERIELPTTPFDAHTRRARLELAVDGEGRVAGRGTLALTGHQARTGLAWRGGDRPPGERWKEWLEVRFPGFAIDEVTSVEAVEEQRVEVSWSLAQRAEGALGDEVSLQPSRPLGPVDQPFTLPVEKRRTPVLLDYADRDEVEVALTWPEGWTVDVAPVPVVHRGQSGELAVATAIDAAARRLVYSRRFDITGREWTDSAGYESLRGLYAAAERHDAEPIVLVGP